ncbi:hypothetical protein ANN_23634, partial [Periplaneta americana]
SFWKDVRILWYFLCVSRRKITLHELLEIMDSSETIPNSGVDVALLPPLNANDDLTDEDSGAEDNPCIDNLPASQLSADVFVTDMAINNVCEESSYEIGLPSGPSPLSRKCRRTRSTTPSTALETNKEDVAGTNATKKEDSRLNTPKHQFYNGPSNSADKQGRQVGRFSREKKLRIAVPQPRLFESYNSHMGGIDRGDQNMSLYRTSIRGKKWYFPIIAHLIDVAEQSAWLLYRCNEENIDHLSFQRRVATAILVSNKRVLTSKASKQSQCPPLAEELASLTPNPAVPGSIPGQDELPGSLYRQPSESTGSLDRPPWNVVKRRWMASATST